MLFCSEDFFFFEGWTKETQHVFPSTLRWIHYYLTAQVDPVRWCLCYGPPATFNLHKNETFVCPANVLCNLIALRKLH